ncbi:hypothetical protein GCM10023224_00780 [Streptomonospora halophila]|uniref:Uncharacterized protein n=1 Tax=Streptomonospora halophila TaxID=427369 RepID=A0ABP9G1U2_9ACTN
MRRTRRTTPAWWELRGSAAPVGTEAAGDVTAGPPRPSWPPSSGAAGGLFAGAWLGLVFGAAFDLAYAGLHRARSSCTPSTPLRLWLAAGGRVPLRPAEFRVDARRWEVLRQLGAHHRIRHAALKRHSPSREPLRWPAGMPAAGKTPAGLRGLARGSRRVRTVSRRGEEVATWPTVRLIPGRRRRGWSGHWPICG